MKIGVMADSHDRLDGTDKALAIFAERKPDMIIHCGDFVAPFTFKHFMAKVSDLNFPVKAVFGNNDAETARIAVTNMQSEKSIELSLTGTLVLEAGDKRIAVYHGQDEAALDALIYCGTYDTVFTGHTHTVRNEKLGMTHVLNPGAVCFIQNGTIIDQGSVAVYDSETNESEIIYFDR